MAQASALSHVRKTEDEGQKGRLPSFIRRRKQKTPPEGQSRQAEPSHPLFIFLSTVTQIIAKAESRVIMRVVRLALLPLCCHDPFTRYIETRSGVGLDRPCPSHRELPSFADPHADTDTYTVHPAHAATDGRRCGFGAGTGDEPGRGASTVRRRRLRGLP